MQYHRRQIESISDEGPTTIDRFNRGGSCGSGEFHPDYVRQLYREFPDELKRQIRVLQHKYCRDHRVLSTYRTIMGSKSHGIDPEVMGYSIVSAIPVFEVVQPTQFKNIYCYNNRGHLIELQKEMVNGKSVRLYAGVHCRTGRKVVVKLFQSDSGRDTSYENDIYRRLGKPEPCFSTAYFLWGCPVLVMAPLKSLDSSDNEYEMAIQVIQQLRRLHRFGVHCDLKPGNIMKRILPDGTKKYLVIDYGGVSIERKEHGYRRWVWSPKWSSQPRRVENGGKDVIATSKNDLIELGHTMKTIQNERYNNHNPDDIKRGFTGKLKIFMDYVMKIEGDVTDKDRAICYKILSEEM
jgi:hypothetical protein